MKRKVFRSQEDEQAADCGVYGGKEVELPGYVDLSGSSFILPTLC